MLHPNTLDSDEENDYWVSVRRTEDLPGMFQFWLAYVARDLLRLGVFFRAAAIMAQLPGAGAYRPLGYDDFDET